MKAIIVQEAGGIENLKITTIEKPQINENEVLVKVSAISINPVDYKVRATENMLSWLFADKRPAILGWDISGTVAESRSPLFQPGDQVFGMHNFPGPGNAYAEYVAANASHLTLKPTNISHEEAAAATLAPLTAWQVFKRAGLKSGQKVLINGASGGVGHYATQLARHLGAEVTGVSSAKNNEFVLGHGAHHHVDYNQAAEMAALKDFDLVFDTVGNKSITEVARPVANGGKVITIVNHNLLDDEIKGLKQKGIEASSLLVSSSGEDMNELARLLANRTIKSHISEIFDFEKIGEAHLQLETGRTVGKVIVRL